MTAITTRTFLCCIPVRAGVVFLSLLGFFGGSLVTAVAVIHLKRSEGSKTSLIIQVVIYVLLALVSIFGLVGAITRKLGFIRLYCGILITHLIFNIATGIFAIHRNFKDAPQYISECSSGSTEPATLKSCRDGANLWKGVLIGIFILGWLLETWACSIVYSYGKQLEEESTTGLVKDTETW
ncbi:hypothetical protein BYT27DRAFT_7220036 [Phlegmacium glaucopus]|nr:hypothetical protein BYT27DRAFT_7220036 [Phlegmacium glaucopus]